MIKNAFQPIEQIRYNSVQQIISVQTNQIFLHYTANATQPQKSPPFFNESIQELLVHPTNGQIFTIAGGDYWRLPRGNILIWDINLHHILRQ
jgi:hypothetical protein